MIREASCRGTNMAVKKRTYSKAAAAATAVILCTVFLTVAFSVFQLLMFNNNYISSDLISPTTTNQGNIIDEVAPFLPPSSPSIIPDPPPQISCDRSHRFYDLCRITGPTVMDPTTSTFFLTSHSTPLHTAKQEKIRPYPRKWENATMARIKELTLTSSSAAAHAPPCQFRHGAPALVFSSGAYTGNFFHDFNDGFIPLFITANTIFPNEDVILVISKARDWWVTKYADILGTFSKHPIINLDNETSTHCFPSVSIGLISHGFMAINPTPPRVTFTHFRAFLTKAYGGEDTWPKLTRPPRLVLVERSGNNRMGRRLLNQKEVEEAAKKVGFEVVVFKPNATTSLREAYELVRSSEVMVGVHGAGLTHLLFMRQEAMVVQVVPLGAEWVSEACFGRSAREMGIEYLEYKIGMNESSLVEKYGKDEMILKDPIGFMGKKWSKEIMDVYLKEQDVRLDLVRFRKHLKKAYRKAKLFLEKRDGEQI